MIGKCFSSTVDRKSERKVKFPFIVNFKVTQEATTLTPLNHLGKPKYACHIRSFTKYVNFRTTIIFYPSLLTRKLCWKISPGSMFTSNVVITSGRLTNYINLQNVFEALCSRFTKIFHSKCQDDLLNKMPLQKKNKYLLSLPILIKASVVVP